MILPAGVKIMPDYGKASKKVSFTSLLAKYNEDKANFKAQIKYHNYEWAKDIGRDLIKNYNELFYAAIRQAENNNREMLHKIEEIKATVFTGHMAGNQDEIVLISSLVARISAEVAVDPANAAAIISNYLNTPAGAKAVLQGITDGKFSAGDGYNNYILKQAISKSKSQAEIAFEESKAKEIKAIQANYFDAVEFGAMLAVKQMQQKAQTNNDIHEILELAKSKEVDKQQLAYINTQRDRALREYVSPEVTL